MNLLLLSLFVATAATAAECLPVEGDIIFGRHLSSAVSGGGSLPADAVFSSAPLPGVTRTISAAEIVRWAQRHGVSSVNAVDICLEWPLRTLEANEVIAAMRSSLPPGAEIKLVELSRQGVPPGRLVFPRNSLREPADSGNVSTPVLWHGFVEYSSHKRYATWARVNLQIQSQRVSATAPIRAGEVIRADQIREETVRLFPANQLPSGHTSTVVGRMARAPIKAGGTVRPVLLNSPPDVKKGDIVELEMRSARTVVRAQAEAQSGGRVGEKLAFRNSSSGKLIHARLVSSVKAEVISANQAIPKGGDRP